LAKPKGVAKISVLVQTLVLLYIFISNSYMNRILQWSIFSILLLLVGCKTDTAKTEEQASSDLAKNSKPVKGTYAYDRSFLMQHGQVLELRGEDSGAKILLSPAWQGRVMTSTAMGDSGTSFGWLNYDLLSAKEKRKQFNPVGGEERFWIGPEGGQFAFYFAPGDSFNIAHWQVPAIIDTIAYSTVIVNNTEAVFAAKAALTNYSGALFNFDITRKINLLKRSQLVDRLGVDIANSIRCVAYETINTITNTGPDNWTQETGLPSIWLLGMFTPSPQTVVVIPFEATPDAGSFITDNYFGTIPPGRLNVGDSLLYFTCDGKYRSKIGISPRIAKPVAASYDFANNTLTLVLPEVHKDSLYVNSKWEVQKEPYKGDVINSYNDGPLADGTQMGPFYEIESSSPAWQLKANEAGTYSQVTCHLQGDYGTLKIFAERLLGVNLDEIKK
jgi:hypothetical protein